MILEMEVKYMNRRIMADILYPTDNGILVFRLFLSCEPNENDQMLLISVTYSRLSEYVAFLEYLACSRGVVLKTESQVAKVHIRTPSAFLLSKDSDTGPASFVSVTNKERPEPI